MLPVTIGAVIESTRAMVEWMRGLGISPEEIVRIVRAEVLRSELERAQWNHSAAAEAMGLHRNTLTRQLHQLNVPSKRPSKEYRKGNQ